MRIGEFAKKYGVSIDSLYFYMKRGLLVPPQRGKQHYFNESCEKDIKTILEFKDWGFSLNEIHSILTLYRLSNMQLSEDMLEIINIMQNKYDQLQAEKERISENQRRIKEEQEKIIRAIPSVTESTSGLPVSMLQLLICPNCGSQLQLSKAEMNPRYISNAEVGCSCGYTATVKNGIFITPNRNTSQHDRPDLNRAIYKDMPFDMISHYQRAYNYMGNLLDAQGLDNKIILETHLNAYFFLQFYIERAASSNVKIILVDKFPEMLEMYKNMLDQLNTGLDILYIADSSYQWPLIPHCADIFIDFFGSNEHQFFSHSQLIGEINAFLKNNARIIGTYFYLNNGRKTLKQLRDDYPEASPNNFDLRAYIKALEEHGFHKQQEAEIGAISSTGDNYWAFGFHQSGEDLSMLSFLADR
ncbi:MAG: MerR family transcriptional regulator [Bacillota bacterium]|nr:MerR family transcriptional regulator [Bacillota bacterium]